MPSLDLNSILPKLRQTPIMIGTPAYGGLVSVPYHSTINELVASCVQMGIPLRNCMIENESLITRARNNIAHMFLNATANIGGNEVPFEYLLFIDADIRCSTQDIFTLIYYAITENLPLVAGSYPKKAINWEMITEAVKAGVPPHELANYCDNAVMNLRPTANGQHSIDLNRPVEVLDTGTGFMLIHRSVFDKIKAAHPELAYTPDYNLRSVAFDAHTANGVWAYFDTGIVQDETAQNTGRKRYLSEDYMFCKHWRDLGGKIYILPWINLVHHGTFHYQGNLPATLQLRAKVQRDAATAQQNVSFVAKPLTSPSVPMQPVKL